MRPLGGLWWPPLCINCAAYRDLTIPLAQVSATPDDMIGEFFTPQVAGCDAVWPWFPAIVKNQLGASVEPGRPKAPDSMHVLITKVEDYTDRGFPPVPPLEFNLTTFVEVEQRPSHCSLHRQLSSVQTSAAANTILLLIWHLAVSLHLSFF
ncbi:hypothetical protein VZT92_010417 [Zoarces viviparus]